MSPGPGCALQAPPHQGCITHSLPMPPEVRDMDMEVEGEMVTRLTSACWVSRARPSPHQDPHPISHGD